ncbi:MAG: head GIN domain-containing protein [Flavobacteriales bacterium]
MRINLALSALLMSGGLLAASAPGDCVKGAGSPEKRTLSVATFHGIVLQGAMDVQLSVASTPSVQVEAQANIAELVMTEVKDGIWVIKTSKCYSTDKPFIVHIAVPEVDIVSIQGSGDVTGTGEFAATNMKFDVQGSGDVRMNVSAKEVRASVQGSGDISLSGTCGMFYAAVQGSGDIKAGELKTASAKAQVEGSGDITVQATENLDANVQGSGDVKYKGKPAHIDSKTQGSGDVKPVE